MWNTEFVARLSRLAEYRGRPLPDLGIPPSDNAGVVLRRAAADLDLDTADLFVLAGVPLPDDLSPIDRQAGQQVKQLVRRALKLDAPARRDLLTKARSITEHGNVLDFTPIRYGANPGSVVYALLRARNLDYLTTTPLLIMLTGRFVAGSVINRIEGGRVRLTPEWLADLGTVLGIPAGLLSAMIGMEVAEVQRPPEVTDAAELIGTVRRFTLSQVESLIETARAG